MGLEIKHIIVFLLAIVPALIWIYLFLRKKHQNKWLILFVFMGGMVAAKLILVYQGYWDETINLVFFKVDPIDFRENIKNIFSNSPILALFLSFVGVGIMEEFLKFWIMKLIGSRFFQSIDDVIELAIISALGFAYYENVVYFTSQWGSLSVSSFAIFAMFRVTIVTMVHILCSGLLGYYFGMAFFSTQMMQVEYLKKKTHPILDFLKRILHLRKDRVFRNEMIAIGLLSAMVLHAIYDFVLTINVNIVGVPLHVPIMLIYFFGGFWYLKKLLKRKDLALKLGLIGTAVMPKEDYEKIMTEVSEAEEKMKKRPRISRTKSKII